MIPKWKARNKENISWRSGTGGRRGGSTGGVAA